MSAAEGKKPSPDLVNAAKAVSDYLKLAEHIKAYLYPEDAPVGLVPALVVALAVTHSATTAADEVTKALGRIESSIPDTDAVADGLEKLESTLDDLPNRLDFASLADRLAGVEQELFKIAERLADNGLKS